MSKTKKRAKDYTEQPALIRGARYPVATQISGLLPEPPRAEDDAARDLGIAFVLANGGRLPKGAKARKGTTDEVTGETERTPREERAHERRMDRWARRYDSLNGAPEGEGDR